MYINTPYTVIHRSQIKITVKVSLITWLVIFVLVNLKTIGTLRIRIFLLINYII